MYITRAPLMLRTNSNPMKSIFLPLLMLIGTALPLVAQETQTTPSVDEIATAYIENTGGQDTWMAVKSTRMEGKASMQGIEFPMTLVAAEGDKMRLDMEIQGSKLTQAYDGDIAWMVFPLQGITEPKQMTEEEAAQFAESPFLSEFINTAERGYVLEAVDGKEIEGAPTYGVRVTNASGYDRTYYFDTENMVPIMVTSVAKGGPMKGMASETLMSDYEEVDGLMVPMFMEQKVNGQSIMKMTFTEVTINPEIPADYFSMKQ